MDAVYLRLLWLLTNVYAQLPGSLIGNLVSIHSIVYNTIERQNLFRAWEYFLVEGIYAGVVPGFP